MYTRIGCKTMKEETSNAVMIHKHTSTFCHGSNLPGNNAAHKKTPLCRRPDGPKSLRLCGMTADAQGIKVLCPMGEQAVGQLKREI